MMMLKFVDEDEATFVMKNQMNIKLHATNQPTLASISITDVSSAAVSAIRINVYFCSDLLNNTQFLLLVRFL